MRNAETGCVFLVYRTIFIKSSYRGTEMMYFVYLHALNYLVSCTGMLVLWFIAYLVSCTGRLVLWFITFRFQSLVFSLNQVVLLAFKLLANVHLLFCYLSENRFSLKITKQTIISVLLIIFYN